MRKARVLSQNSSAVLPPPITQWGPYAARAWAPVLCHPRHQLLIHVFER